jgi:hypothetical protein
MGLSCLIQLHYLSLHEDHANFQLLNSGTGFVQKYLLATHHTSLAYLDSVEIAKFPIPHVAAISLLLLVVQLVFPELPITDPLASPTGESKALLLLWSPLPSPEAIDRKDAL